MPKQIGFNLYALIVYYKDGNRCVCYARKTDEWYYFSDKMDFRIQLTNDNRTITKQEWRRKHYESSWYESDMLDYVDLMEFGENYLQDELNPIRTDVVNNYNEFKNYTTYIYNIVGAEGEDDYDRAMDALLYLNNLHFKDFIKAVTSSLIVLRNNWNDLIRDLKAAWPNLISTWGGEAKLNLPMKKLETENIEYYWAFNHDIHTETIPTVISLEDETAKSVESNEQGFYHFIQHVADVTGYSIDESPGSSYSLRARLDSLENRVTALENK